MCLEPVESSVNFNDHCVKQVMSEQYTEADR